MNLRLVLENIEARARQFPSFQCIDQSGFIHDLSPSSIDEERSRLHQRELPGADGQVAVRVQWSMQAKEIGLAQQFRKAHQLSRGLSLQICRHPISRVIENPHPEPTPSPRHGLADAAKAVESEGLAIEFGSPEKIEQAALPFSVAHVTVGFKKAAADREQQRESKIGGGFGEDVPEYC